MGSPLPSLYALSDLARATGISRRVLQHYARLGLLEPGALTHGGRKLYTEFALSLVQDIQDLNQLGFSLEEIRKIMLLKKAIFRPDGTYREDWKREDIPLSDEELLAMWQKTGEVLASMERQERMIRRFHRFLTKHFAPEEVRHGLRSGPGDGGA
ncbi:DNA-binding transcriptional regulator, MerR family [Thermus arciformis]|uniref:DNA-binding transcriptional regulator, MerR family n=2 Tax=Thermus TaxID=270 RepID=A0A1G7KIS1_9DEIN|nr:MULTISPECIES: MerR family transcriptional regulator [Thermus]BCZ90703.1 MerR family transcriptional regulator [Thermus thermophilus]SDF37102.1 DNA-binding transcriptional regulator, MerR family [Thermus arciformis]